MSLSCRVLNGICRFLYRREYKKFIRSCDVENVQRKYLKDLLKKNTGNITL